MPTLEDLAATALQTLEDDRVFPALCILLAPVVTFLCCLVWA